MPVFDPSRRSRPIGPQTSVADDLQRMARAAEGLAGRIERAPIPLARKAEVLAELSSASASLARAAKIVEQSADSAKALRRVSQ